MKFIFLGPPGAGKGTIAAMISERYGIAHISTGDMLRKEMREGSELGKAAKRYVDEGGLVPDDVILAMVANRINQSDCEKGYILDGFPRTIPQAEALSKIADIDMVVDFETSYDTIVYRISGRRMCPGCGASFHTGRYSGTVCDKCGATLYTRDDDKEETVRKRVEVYNASTAPLIEYYKARGLLQTVNGDNDFDERFADLLKLSEPAV